eukprot:m.89784 g.89784  ORF g.89784 m.89784 type:complete len:526 (-) comp13240_c0_seq1:1080-2657(-)
MAPPSLLSVLCLLGVAHVALGKASIKADGNALVIDAEAVNFEKDGEERNLFNSVLDTEMDAALSEVTSNLTTQLNLALDKTEGAVQNLEEATEMSLDNITRTLELVKEEAQMMYENLSSSKSDKETTTNLINGVQTGVDSNKESINKIMGCFSKGMQLQMDGTCKAVLKHCDKNQAIASGLSGVSASMKTVATTIGSVAFLSCSDGYYAREEYTACLESEKWSVTDAKCAPCTMYTNNIPSCHTKAIYKDCKDTYALGKPSGYYQISDGKGGKYEAYCMNDGTLGIDLETKGLGAGGGWEIVLVQNGGNSIPSETKRYSTRNMRRLSGQRTKKIVPPSVRTPAGPNKAGSQMTDAWLKYASTEKVQWMKFTQIYYSTNVQARQDRFLLDFNGGGTMKEGFNNDWTLPNVGRCKQLQKSGYIDVEVNGVNIGRSYWLLNQGAGSLGLPSWNSNRCNGNRQHHPSAQSYYARHGFTRQDGNNRDNTLKHLIAYSDTSTGRDRSRCHYCCWGCGGMFEVVMWGARVKA